MYLQSEFDRIEKAIPHMTKRNEKVSKSTVAWQIDRSLKVICGVADIMRKSNPADYKRDFNFRRFYVFSMRKIPRGVGKSPKSVQPPENITSEDILEQLSKAKYLTQQIQTLPKKSHFKHSFFGMLNKKKCMRFIELHTQHHLSIIDDITS